MKKTTVLLLSLAWLSLACLATTEPMVTYPAETAVTPNEQESFADEPYTGTVYELPTLEQTCAQVNTTALHLRVAPDEHAQVIDWLSNGEVVTVHTRGKWSLVTANKYTGYVHSAYLQETECNP